ncbi:MAG: hypothetical protein AAEJ04_04435 [Planctomycetota bacterium]
MSSKPEPLSNPLPHAGSRAKNIVRLQLLKAVLYGASQLLRFPAFLFTRHKIKKQMADLIERPEDPSARIS